MHYWAVLPHASRNLEERAVGLGAPPPTQGSLGGTSHDATPSKGRRPPPPPEVGSDSRGRRSLTCVAAPRLSSRFPQVLPSHGPGSSSSDLVPVGAWALEVSEHIGCTCVHTHVRSLHACVWQALEMTPEPIGCMYVHTRVYMLTRGGVVGKTAPESDST